VILQRPSTPADIPAITAIYAHYVGTSVSTFELEPPDADELARRRRAVVEAGLPHVVVESEGVVLGYAYASPYRPRKAYRFAVEDSIYIHPEHTRKGLGRVLLAAVIQACDHTGYRQMVAVIGGADNTASIRLHAAFGFQQAGVLRSVGFKFGMWVDTVLMQRALGPGNRTIPG
jgi:L-amino acid N-acyltransferase YncA